MRIVASAFLAIVLSAAPVTAEPPLQLGLRGAYSTLLHPQSPAIGGERNSASTASDHPQPIIDRPLVLPAGVSEVEMQGDLTHIAGGNASAAYGFAGRPASKSE